MLRRFFVSTAAPLARRRNILIPNNLVYANSFRNFRLSPSHKAIPPLLYILWRPISHVGAIIFGRVFRKWWLSLPPDRQRKLYEMFMKQRKKLLYGGVGAFGAGVVYYVYHIERTPITNRRRYVTMTPKQLEKVHDFTSNHLLTLYQSKLLKDTDRRVKRIKIVVKKLLESNTDVEQFKNRHWTIHVIEEKAKNCFVVPNGHIFVFSAFLDDFKDNDDQLGIVLGHELAHAVLGHTFEQASWSGLVDVVKIGLWAAIWAIIPFPLGAAFTDLFATSVLDVVATLPYSRTLEMEADDVGLRFAAKACFDPRESYAFWLGMHMKDRVEHKFIVPPFLTTHPSHGDRAERCEKNIEEAIKLRSECKCPPLKPYDPRLLAEYKKQLIEQQLALKGQV